MRRFAMLIGLVTTLFVLPGVARPADAINSANHPENVWVKQSPRQGAPSPRIGWEGSGDLDPAANLWIHHAGHDSNPQGFITFTWDLASGLWRQRFPNTSPPGVCCVDGGNVFDQANRRFVRFPGGSMGHGWQWSRAIRLKDSSAWLYDVSANRWTNMRPPPYAEPPKYSREILGSLDGCATYDPTRGLCIRFGGQTSGGGTNVLHVYDAYSNTLTRINPTGEKPSERDGSGVAFDSDADRLIMFASQYSNDEKTWLFDFKANRWESHDLSPRPPGRKDQKTYATIPKMAYDPLHKVSLCIVWLDKEGHQTWAFDAAAMKWTQLNPKVEPDPSLSRSRNLGFAVRHNLFILDSMTAAGEAQMWTYRYTRSPDPRPAPPTDLAVVTEANRATLTWKPGTAVAPKGYAVYRWQGDDAVKMELAKVASVNATSYQDSTVQPGKVYFYAVRAVGENGVESRPSYPARTQPRVLSAPVVSMLEANKAEVSWQPSDAADVAGYNLYRGLVRVGTVKDRGKGGKWVENSPGYPEPVVSAVRDITGIARLNPQPLTGTSFVDDKVDLARKGDESADYKYAVYAYIVRAVNRLGVESGPSPYALTMPSAVQNVMIRETAGGAELKWSASPEKNIAGYLVHRMADQYGVAELVTEKPIAATQFKDSPKDRARYFVVAVDSLGQQGEPSSPAWYRWSYKGFFDGEWHQ